MGRGTRHRTAQLQQCFPNLRQHPALTYVGKCVPATYMYIGRYIPNYILYVLCTYLPTIHEYSQVQTWRNGFERIGFEGLTKGGMDWEAHMRGRSPWQSHTYLRSTYELLYVYLYKLPTCTYVTGRLGTLGMAYAATNLHKYTYPRTLIMISWYLYVMYLRR